MDPIYVIIMDIQQIQKIWDAIKYKKVKIEHYLKINYVRRNYYIWLRFLIW